MSKMTTRARAAAQRKAATVEPAQRTVILASGRGAVHTQHPGTDGAPYPACRATGRTSLRTARYAHTTTETNCDKCLDAAKVNEAARAAREASRAQDRVSTAGRVKKESPRATRARRNGTAQQEAEVKATEIIAQETAAVLAKRGTHVQMNDERKPGCSDEDYALAVQVRTLRAAGMAWWAIAHKMELKGHGPSVKQGKTGAAHARRLWERAWGPTYKDTSVERDTKARKVERAITQPGKPYFTQDTPDREVLDAVTGKTIEWTTRLGAGDTVVCSIQTAIVGNTAQVVLGPKGRVIKFYELPEPGSRVSGPLRSVYIDRIEKVGL